MILHDLLLAVEVLGLEVELGAVDERLGGSQTDDLALDDAGAVALGQSLDHFIGDIERGILIVDHVHGDLRDAAVLEHEAHGLAAAEAAGGAADDLGDLLGDLNVAGLEVAVERDERHTGADGGDAGGGVDLALAVVGRPLGLQELLGHTLELALAAGGKVAALRTGGAVLIQEGGDLQLVPDALSDALGHLDGFLHGHVHLGDEGDDVGRAHALVLAVVLVHVDALGGDLRELEGDLLDGLGGADQGEHAAVVVAVGLGVEQGAAGPEACVYSSSLAIRLAKENNARLHILHISTAQELDLFEDKPLSEKKITAEACVSHLYFYDKDYEALKGHIKCNPSIKTLEDRNALRKALSTNRIDVIGTDHAPHLLKEKEGGALKAVSGMPMIQFSLVAIMELVREGVLSMEQLVQKMCHAPAELYNIERRGYLRPGYQADLVLVNPDHEWTVTADCVLSKCGWSPMEGQKFHSRVEKTFVNGDLVYSDNKVDESHRGQELRFKR